MDIKKTQVLSLDESFRVCISFINGVGCSIYKTNSKGMRVEYSIQHVGVGRYSGYLDVTCYAPRDEGV